MENINKKSYALRINPFIDEKIGEELSWIHDNASLHTALESLQEVGHCEMTPIIWPACGTDQNSIETM